MSKEHVRRCSRTGCEDYEAAKSAPNATELRCEIKKEINICKDIKERHSELEEKLEIAEQDREAGREKTREK